MISTDGNINRASDTWKIGFDMDWPEAHWHKFVPSLHEEANDYNLEHEIRVLYLNISTTNYKVMNCNKLKESDITPIEFICSSFLQKTFVIFIWFQQMESSIRLVLHKELGLIRIDQNLIGIKTFHPYIKRQMTIN